MPISQHSYPSFSFVTETHHNFLPGRNMNVKSDFHFASPTPPSNLLRTIRLRDTIAQPPVQHGNNAALDDGHNDGANGVQRSPHRRLLKDFVQASNTVLSYPAALHGVFEHDRSGITGHWDLWRCGVNHQNISLRPTSTHLVDPDTSLTKGVSFMANNELDVNVPNVFKSYMVLTNDTVPKEYGHEGDYLDPLESFYWILVWTLMGTDPNQGTYRITAQMSQISGERGQAASLKYSLLRQGRLQLASGWSGVFKRLEAKMRGYLFERVDQRAVERDRQFRAGEKVARLVPPVKDPKIRAEAEQVYPIFIKLFDNAIEQLKLEMDTRSDGSQYRPLWIQNWVPSWPPRQ
ncbi:hypothetical protein CVT24_007872 [Panaeolus cyanescens]|uniref:Fungal-type protein kinase domain-containing protein n=1 Tax=Panaeolus cyanescens TaxID=181874 RepID=A0A409WRL8_9AGAR|nr:hypothetical protein CVT24_007872 [Panaeolus cyanescens]